MTTVIRRLEALRRRARVVLVVERAAVLLAFMIAIVCAWAMIDALARFPMPIRLGALAIGAASLGLLIHRWWWPAAVFRPPLTELALRVERQRPELSGELASSVEFQGREPRGALESRAIDRTERIVGDHGFSSLVRRDRITRAIIGLVAALAVPITIIAIDPDMASIGAKRALLPWSGAEWPARTMVRSLMGEVTHLPRSGAILLRAEATRGDPASMRPFVRYRLVREGKPGPWRDAILARQQNGLFERPIDADADAIDFQFGTSDALTPVASIELVRPPAIRSALLTASPPPYAARSVEVRRVDLGTGSDARGVLAAPVLAGSDIDLSLEVSSTVPVPVDADLREAWLRTTFGSEWPAGATVEVGDAATERVDSGGGRSMLTNQLRLRAIVQQDWNIPITLRDQHGIASEDGARFRVPVVPDRAPSASVTEPAADEVVLPTASLRLVAEARDDVSLAEIGLRIERTGAEAVEHRRTLDAESGQFELTLTPASIGAGPGETLVVSAVATDSFEIEGQRRAPTVSVPRRIRVVGEEEFTRQIRAQLATIRQSAIRAESTQRDIVTARDPEQGTPAPAADQARRQAQLTDRIGTMRDAVASIEARARSGGLDRDALGEIMRQAIERLGTAGRTSADAAAKLAEEAAAATQAAATAGDEQSRAQAADKARQAAAAASQAQEDTRAEIEDLVRLLDRDEDAWIATRKLERLTADLDRLLEETRRAGERTVGRDLESLSADERMELDRLAGRDRSAAQEARDTLEELRDRAERLSQADRTRAAGMREAARRGEERQIARRLEEASERTSQNQPTNAEQSLREATEAARSMMEAIRDDRRARTEELRRRLATIEESIRALVQQADGRLTDLRGLPVGAGAAAIAAIATGVISLDRNIGAATDEARTGQGTERAARLLERAGERSATSAARLRAEPPDVVGGDEALDRTRALLAEALAVIREQRQQAESQEAEAKRAELAAALRALSERQAGLRTAAEPLVGAEAQERRRLVEGRRLGVEQQLIRSNLADLRRDSTELAESQLFDSASKRLEEWMTRGAEQLSRVQVTQRTLAELTLAAETLAMMGQALAGSEGSNDPFEEAAAEDGDEAAGGAGNSGQQRPGAIPPLAELRLLRETQAQVARRTRAIDEIPSSPDERAREIKELAGLQQELLEQGQSWVERLRQGGPRGSGAAPAPAPPEGEEHAPQ